MAGTPARFPAACCARGGGAPDERFPEGRRSLVARAGFTEDGVFRFAEQPERRGRAALREFFTARLARQKGYRLKKTLLALDRNVLTNLWEGTWEDRDTGKKMAGRGLETWRMRDGMIAGWDAAFNVWQPDGPRTSPIM